MDFFYTGLFYNNFFYGIFYTGLFYNCIDMLNYAAASVQEANNIWIFHTTLTKGGSFQTCLVQVDLSVYVSLTYTTVMAPDVEIGERYLLWKQELLI